MLLDFLWFLSRSMFPCFVAKNIDTECGDKCGLATACKGEWEEGWQSGTRQSWLGRQEAMP